MKIIRREPDGSLVVELNEEETALVKDGDIGSYSIADPISDEVMREYLGVQPIELPPHLTIKLPQLSTLNGYGIVD